MSLYENLQGRPDNFTVELLTPENADRYAEILYSNENYYMLTEGRPAVWKDVIETVEYCPGDFLAEKCYCMGFSLNGEAAAVLSLLEDHPHCGTLYIGLFLVNEKFKRRGIGTKIIRAVIDEAFIAGFGVTELSVQDNNLIGTVFWESLGFCVTGRTDCNGFENLSMEYKYCQHTGMRQERDL